MFKQQNQGPTYLLALTLVAFGACGDDSPGDQPAAGSSAGGKGGGGSAGKAGAGGTGGSAGKGGSGGAAGSGGSVYALANTVTTPDSTTTYVHVVSSLDIKDKVGTQDAREYGKYATIAAVGGDLLIASDEEPVVQRFSVGSDLKLIEGDKLNLAEQGLASAAFYRNVFLSDEKAYYNVGEVERVLWNPKEMVIEGDAPASGLDPKDGSLLTFAAYDRGVALSEGRAYQPYYYHDQDFYEIGAKSKIVIYGMDDKPEKTLDIECPGLDTATKDADGNLYFSTWAGTIGYRLNDKSAAKSCAVRIDAGKTEVKETFRFEDLTDGRETAMYKYMKDGVGTLAVYNTDGLDLDKVDDAKKLNGEARWELWRVNIAKQSAEAIGGLPKFSGGYYSFTIDERTLVLLPSADLSSTSVYEVKPEGDAVKLFETTGWTYQLIKVR